MNGHVCLRDEWKLSALADGELPPDEAEAVKTHLRVCERCAAAHARLEGLRRILVASERPCAPADYLVRLRARMEGEGSRPLPLFFSWARLAGLAAFLVVGVAVERGFDDSPLGPRPAPPSSRPVPSRPSPSSHGENASAEDAGSPELDGYLRSIRLAPEPSSPSSGTMKTWRPRQVPAAPASSAPAVASRSVPSPSRRLAGGTAGSSDALMRPLGLGSRKLASMSETGEDEVFDPSLRRDAARLVLEPDEPDAVRGERAGSEDAPVPERASSEEGADVAWLETLFPERVRSLEGEDRERFVEMRDDRLRWMVESPRPRTFFRSLKDGLDALGLPVEAVLPASGDRWELYVELAAADDPLEARRRLRELLADLDVVSGLAFLEQTEEGDGPRGLWIVLDLAY